MANEDLQGCRARTSIVLCWGDGSGNRPGRPTSCPGTAKRSWRSPQRPCEARPVFPSDPPGWRPGARIRRGPSGRDPTTTLRHPHRTSESRNRVPDFCQDQSRVRPDRRPVCPAARDQLPRITRLELQEFSLTMQSQEALLPRRQLRYDAKVFPQPQPLPFSGGNDVADHDLTVPIEGNAAAIKKRIECSDKIQPVVGIRPQLGMLLPRQNM
jgi:hypothetical protein